MTATHGSSDDTCPQSGDHEGPSSQPGRGALFVGAALFDAGRHHAAHEVFEEAWNGARHAGRPAEALWWQGLVLCAGALHHREKGNRTGEEALSGRAAERLAAALAAINAAADAPADAAANEGPAPACEPIWWTTACRIWLERWRAFVSAPPGGNDPRLGDLLGEPPHGQPADRE